MKNVGARDILEQMREDTQEQYRYGGWSTGHPKHAIVHEIGHAVEQYSLNPQKEQELQKRLRQELYRITGMANIDIAKALEDLDTETKLRWGVRAKKNLSVYACFSVREMVAEAVAQAVLDEPSELAQQILFIALS